MYIKVLVTYSNQCSIVELFIFYFTAWLDLSVPNYLCFLLGKKTHQLINMFKHFNIWI
jgi:hypothetical protein